MNEHSIFIAALEHDLPSRRAYLQEACGRNDELRCRVERLLSAHENAAKEFMEHPAGDLGATAACQPSPAIGTQIGPFKLLQQIGEGGMGTVYMAEQTHPVQRKVALKVIKAGMDSRQIIARFEAERQALAMMDHVNIARVLDAGATEQGRPYFVMELVHGVPITKYCDDNHLTPRQRLELFVPVCQAIQHAHQKGIIHRDIKPSNVMVTLYDGKPVPKVIDFGVAKAVEQKLTGQTLFTQYGTMVGTLEYMSPEQAEMSALGVDTRSDIYSLGVLLYQLLTGSTPLSRKQMKEAAIGEILRLIREEEPPKPSTRLSDSGEALASISAQRHMEPAKLTKLVKGELDWIVMKALDKDRNRRYETANGFAMDVQRYLTNEPVAACPPSAAYRFRKLAQRNKVALLTAAVVTATLVLGTVISTWQAIRATRAEELAQIRLEAEKDARNQAEIARSQEGAQRVIADQQRRKAEHEQKNAEANLAKAREAVDQMLTRVGETSLTNVPQMEPVRKALLEDALQFYQGFLQQNSGDPSVRLGTAKAWRRVGDINASLGQLDQAHQAYQESIVLLEKLVAEFPLEPGYRTALAGSYADLGFLLAWNIDDQRTAEGVFAQAMALEQALATEFPHLPEHRFSVGNIALGLGSTLQHLGRLDEAEKQLRRAVTVLGEVAVEAPDYRYQQATGYLRLGALLAASGRRSEAENALRQALAIQEPMVAEDPANRWRGHQVSDINYQLAGVLRDDGRAKEAEERYRSALEITQQLAADFPSIRWQRAHLASVQLGLARLLVQQQRLPEAEEVFRQARGTMETLIAEGLATPYWRSLLLASQSELAKLLNEAGRTQESEQVYRQAITSLEKLVADSPEDPDYRRDLAAAHLNLGNLLHGAGLNPEAEQNGRKSQEILEQLVAEFPKVPDYRFHLANTICWLGAPLDGLGRRTEAEKCNLQAIAILQTLVAEHPGVASYSYFLGKNLGYLAGHQRQDGRIPEAELSYRQSFTLSEELAVEFPNEVPNQENLERSHFRLGHLLLVTGRGQEAEKEYGLSLAGRNKLVELKPNAVAQNNLAWLLATCPAAKLRDASRAVALARKAVELAPNVGSHWNTLGTAHYRAGDWKAAIAAFEKSMELRQGGDSFDWFFLAMAHWQLDDKDQVRKWNDQAVQWMEKNQPQNEELRRFRVEAAQLLGITDKNQPPESC